MIERSRLEARIYAALKQAVAEDRLDIAEHLLRTLEALDQDAPKVHGHLR